MASRAELAAETKEKHLGALRLQEKFNCVRQYHGLGTKKPEDFWLHDSRFSPFCANSKKRPRNDEEEAEEVQT